MKPSRQYLLAYERLFRLVMSGGHVGADGSPTREAECLRAKLDRLWMRLPGWTAEDKLASVLPAAWEMYEAELMAKP